MLQTGDRSSIVDKSCLGLKHLVEISWSFGKSVAMSGQEKVFLTVSRIGEVLGKRPTTSIASEPMGPNALGS